MGWRRGATGQRWSPRARAISRVNAQRGLRPRATVAVRHLRASRGRCDWSRRAPLLRSTRFPGAHSGGAKVSGLGASGRLARRRRPRILKRGHVWVRAGRAIAYNNPIIASM